MMAAVVNAERGMQALRKTILGPIAHHIIKKYLAGPGPEVSFAPRRLGTRKAQLPARDPGVVDIPVVVTHGAPLSPDGHFHTTLAWGAASLKANYLKN